MTETRHFKYIHICIYLYNYNYNNWPKWIKLTRDINDNRNIIILLSTIFKKIFYLAKTQ